MEELDELMTLIKSREYYIEWVARNDYEIKEAMEQLQSLRDLYMEKLLEIYKQEPDFTLNTIANIDNDE